MAKVNRNDPCPCGSGKKYKKCCGAAPAKKKIEAVNLTGQSMDKIQGLFAKRKGSEKKDET